MAKPISIECKMADYSNSLYEHLEEETGVKTGGMDFYTMTSLSSTPFVLTCLQYHSSLSSAPFVLTCLQYDSSLSSAPFVLTPYQ